MILYFFFIIFNQIRILRLPILKKKNVSILFKDIDSFILFVILFFNYLYTYIYKSLFWTDDNIVLKMYKTIF